jgi:PAS domain S-box-containing protein
MLTEHLAPLPLAARSPHRFAVLLVDDDDRYARFVREIFERMPGSEAELHHVRRLGDVFPALESNRFSVILLDVTLPDGDGVEWLLENRSRLKAAVIVLTGDPEYVLHADIASVAQDFIVKFEVQPEHLVRAVRYAADRERVRQDLVRSREYFQSLIEQARDLITVVTEDGCIVYQSPAIARVLGRSPESSIGHALYEIVIEPDVARLREMLESVFAGNTAPPGGEFQVRHADGTARILDIVASRVPSEGMTRRAVLNSRDVTERRQAEEALRARDEQLRQAMKMEAIGRLAGGIAHDFSNVLTVIDGACEKLQDEIAAGEAVSSGEVDTILSNSRRAASLTRQLLAFSRQQTLSPQPLDMGQLIGRAGRLLKQLIGEHIALSVDIAPELPAVEADPVQIEQVLMNLAINARDAMAGGGSLQLTLAKAIVDDAFAERHPPMPPGSYVLLTVSDTGCGMSELTKARAFEPFYTTKGLQGTGLGLSTVYGIVKQSGGYIWLSSIPGEGTTFRIFMPPTDAAPVSQDMPQPAAAVRPGVLGTILLTEDDHDVRVMLAAFLNGAGHTVIEAHGPDDAVAKAAAFEGHIDLLLTDVVMPGGSGRELADRLTAVRPEVQLLYMSGYPEYGGSSGSVLEPGVPFLAKPFTRATLLSTIDNLLRA